MNKKVIIVLVLALATLPVFSSEFGMVFNINYNIGNSDFFDRNETLYQSGGYNYLESKRNKLGMGFNTGVIIPVTSKLSIIPSFTVNFGHQSYEFAKIEGASDNDISETYSLLTYSGAVAANYDILTLGNGWRIVLHIGANYNKFQADDESGIEDTDYLGAEAGIGAKFFQMENFGFQVFVIYRYPFTESDFRYLSLQAGIIYRF
ncbi:MAG: hypothetical protein ABFR36_04425 [Acidobacteriota bacterium]